MKKYLMIGGVVAALAIGAFAVVSAGAQEATPTPTDEATSDQQARLDHYLEVLADNLGVSVDELKSGLTQTQIDLINEKVADGTLTQDEANDLIDKIENGDTPLFPPFFRGDNDGGHHPLLRVVGNVIDSAAEVLGLDSSDVKDQLQNGSSLADIAAAQGVDVDTFKAELQDNLQAKIDAAVADGTITEEMGQRLSDGLADHIDRIVEATPGDGPFGGDAPMGGEGFGFGPRGGRFFDGNGPFNNDSEENSDTSLTF